VRAGERVAAGATLSIILIVSRASQINGHGRKNGRPAIKLTAQRSKISRPKEAIPQIAGGKNNDWLLWQLCDSAFPTGGFAHSLGLEAAWQHGEVRNRAELVSFLQASLHQLGHAALPFVTAALPNRQNSASLTNCAMRSHPITSPIARAARRVARC
jgi:hypothetical protein